MQTAGADNGDLAELDAGMLGDAEFDGGDRAAIRLGVEMDFGIGKLLGERAE